MILLLSAAANTYTQHVHTHVWCQQEEEAETTKCRGFGFVAFEEPNTAAAAVKALNGSEYRGKELYAGRAQKKSERQELLKNQFDELRSERMQKTAGLNLYVKNLADDVDEDALRTLFAGVSIRLFSACGPVCVPINYLNTRSLQQHSTRHRHIVPHHAL